MIPSLLNTRGFNLGVKFSQDSSSGEEIYFHLALLLSQDFNSP